MINQVSLPRAVFITLIFLIMMKAKSLKLWIEADNQLQMEYQLQVTAQIQTRVGAAYTEYPLQIKARQFLATLNYSLSPIKSSNSQTVTVVISVRPMFTTIRTCPTCSAILKESQEKQLQESILQSSHHHHNHSLNIKNKLISQLIQFTPLISQF